MPIPPYKAFIEPIVRYLAPLDAAVAAGTVCEAAANALRLTGEDRDQPLASGGPVYRNRASWAFNWLKRAGLASAPSPGEWQLTREGKQLAAAHPAFTKDILAMFAARVESRSPDARTSEALRSPAPTVELVGNRKAYRLPPRPLAGGGQADVYEAVRKIDGRIFILKRSRSRFGRNRMRREIEVQSSLSHENIMPIVDWDRQDHSWYVMPRGIRAMVELERPLEPAFICAIVQSVAAALDYAHASGHPHRDVKPQNIIELPSEGDATRWVLADWGLTRKPPGETSAKWTSTGQFLGTEGFAPPEAYYDAHKVGAPGDIYALGQVIAWATGVDPVPNISPIVAPPWRHLVEAMTQQQAHTRLQTLTDVQKLILAICKVQKG